MNSQFECEVGNVRSGEPCVVTVRGDVDLASAPELETSLRQALDTSPSSIVLDFGGLTFLDSSGLRVLVSIANEARSRGANLGLRNVPNHARRVLEITGLSDLFDAGSNT